MKRIKFILASLCLALFVFTSCSDDDESARTNLTPAEQKTEIKNVLNGMIDQVKPEDQKELLEVIAHFCANLDISSPMPSKSTAALKSVLSATQAAYTTYSAAQLKNVVPGVLSLSMLYGTYTFDEELGEFGEWVATPNSTALEFKFQHNGRLASFVLDPSEKTKNSTIKAINDDDKLSLTLAIPENIKAYISLGEKKLLDAKAELDLNETVSAGKIKVAAKANNYELKLELKANPSHVDFDATFKIDGKEFIDIEIEGNGTNMTVAQAIVDAVTGEDEELGLLDLYHDAKVEITLGDEIKLKGECTDFKKLLMPIFKDEDVSLDDFIEIYKATTKVEMYYTDGDNVIATLGIINVGDDEIIITIDFVIDGSQEPVEKYFNKEFYGSLGDSLKVLFGKYEEIINKYLPVA